MKKALIVEDDISHQNIFRLLTRQQDCIADVVDDGNQALARIQSTEYDLVILDIKLPNMDGYQVLEYLSAHEPELLQRTLVVSAIREKALEVIRQLYEVPVIAKPFNLEDMAGGIKSVLSYKR